jgi:hypothetical protein
MLPVVEVLHGLLFDGNSRPRRVNPETAASSPHTGTIKKLLRRSTMTVVLSVVLCMDLSLYMINTEHPKQVAKSTRKYKNKVTIS